MRNRSSIIVFTVLFVLACLWELSYTFITAQVEKEGKEIAIQRTDSLIQADGLQLTEVERDSLLHITESDYLLGITHKKVYLGFDYKHCKRHELNLGLDLQGGMNVILEVSLVDMLRALSDYNEDPAFKNAIGATLKKQRSSDKDFLTLFEESWDELNPDMAMATVFNTRDNKDMFRLDMTNEEVMALIREKAEGAVSNTEKVLRKRIDNLGVIQPKIQRLESSGRIVVELPGVKNKSRVRTILQSTAKLEFWNTFENGELYPKFEAVNRLLAAKLKAEEEHQKHEDESIIPDAIKDSLSQNTVLQTQQAESLKINDLESLMGEANEPGSLSVASTEVKPEATDSADINAPKDFAEFARENPLFGVLRPLLVQDPQSGSYYPATGPAVGYANLTDTAKVNKYLSREDVKAVLPANVKLIWEAKPYDDDETFVRLFAIKVESKDGSAPLTGEHITNARVDNDPMGNPEVTLIMDSEGAQIWKQMTKEAANQTPKRSVAIVLDNVVHSAPTVQVEIAGGRSSISGRFSVEEADDLANVLKAGELPAPSKIINEAIVGPTLGAENVRDGLFSFLIALLIILIYMAFYYARAGVVADFALIANMFFIMGVLTSLGATLTLPGIAGIVLTIGMSVDANVLIFERIREELREGKGIRLAVEDGYKNAYSSIIDANITTLLTGVVLYIFGTGPIKGFATTLIIGILTSLFSAIFITRLIFERNLDRKRAITFANSITKNFLANVNLPFVKNRKFYYLVSGLIIAAGIVSFITRGLNYGVDFKGGNNFLVRFDKTVAAQPVAQALGNQFIDETGIKHIPEVKTYGSSDQLMITTKFMIDDDSPDAQNILETKLKDGLKTLEPQFGSAVIEESQKVGPTIADDIKIAAVWSVLFSLLIIFLYLLLRFKKWQFGVGALLALAHDVVIVLSVFSICYSYFPFMEIDQAFIAAILTVVGYSINDTVVVFDRIREFIARFKRREQKDIINQALNSTLSRTINTSLTTFFVLLIIFLFGGDSIRGFVFALLIGVVVGTYSSVCIATPIVVDLERKKREK